MVDSSVLMLVKLEIILYMKIQILKEVVQSLCQAANPLGKSMDYLQVFSCAQVWL
jgi:hypothetical protein